MTNPSPFIDTDALKVKVGCVHQQLNGFAGVHGAWLATEADAQNDFAYLQTVIDSILTAKSTGSAIGRTVNALELLNYFQRQITKRDATLADEPHLAHAAHLLHEEIPAFLQEAEALGITRINDPYGACFAIRFDQFLAHHPFDANPNRTFRDAEIAQTRAAFVAFDRALSDPRMPITEKVQAANDALGVVNLLAKAAATTHCVGMAVALAALMRDQWQKLTQEAMQDPDAAHQIRHMQSFQMPVAPSFHRPTSVF